MGPSCPSVPMTSEPKAPKLPLVRIASTLKEGAKTTSPQTQLRDIAHQLAMLLYGKKCGTSVVGCLGASGAFHQLAKTRAARYQVVVSADMWASDPTFAGYVRSMAGHATKNGIQMSFA